MQWRRNGGERRGLAPPLNFAMGVALALAYATTRTRYCHVKVRRITRSWSRSFLLREKNAGK